MTNAGAEKLKIEYVKPHELNPAEYNPRHATEKQHQELRQSIERFGFKQPIIVNSAENRKNVIIGGHFRHRIAIELGMETVPVIYMDIPDIAEEQELNLRLNKNTGSFDFDMLANMDEELLMNVGFTAKEMDDIFDLEPGKAQEKGNKEVSRETSVKLGDIYKLGEHRLMCGDSTDPEQCKALMNGQEAKMVFTDPPYNVNYKGKGENTSEGIENDHMDAASFTDFIEKAFESMHSIMAPGAVFFICSGWSSYPTFQRALVDIGFYHAGVIIWKKDNASYGWNDFRYKHEWIVVGKKKHERIKAVSIHYGWKQGTHYFRDTRDEYDVWEVPRKHAGAYKHPTEKPIWLVEKALANSSERGWPVADLFAGSGSTLIACERLKRKCHAMEFDPYHAQTIIDRWEEFTGKKAEKLSGQ